MIIAVIFGIVLAVVAIVLGIFLFRRFHRSRKTPRRGKYLFRNG